MIGWLPSLFALAYAPSLEQVPITYVWPQPKAATSSQAPDVQVAPPARGSPGSAFFKLSSSTKASPLLEQAFERYLKLTFPHETDSWVACPSPPAPSPPIAGLTISVANSDESHPSVSTDESYALHVDTSTSSTSATATAPTVYGALRALETFSQLVTYDFDCGVYTVPAGLNITDAPRFPHRGLMIDTARHYQPLASIRRVIDSLPFAKINVLHWHMVDTQSFPFQSKTHPKLWVGSYPNQRYTQSDIAAVVEYARLRGVRVIVEFDMPGHAQSWCAGYPEICPSPTCTTPLNVANNYTFDLIEQLLGECTGGKASAPGTSSGLFPDEFIHLGGDEVNTGCWSSTPAIADWLTKQKMTADEGYAYFVKRVAAIAIKQGRRPIQWSEVFDHFKASLPKETIVHVWKDVTNVTEVVALGYNVIRNVGYDATSWYLDNLNVNWRSVYSNEPCSGIPDSLCGKVLGGHGEMWGETVDASDIEQTVWPRLAAIAEKLWSQRAVTTDPDPAEARILQFRCLLNERGIAAAPVRNTNARSAPPGPGACAVQRRR